ncbi:HYC_CC_PP family protein [Chitinophaga rhizophila]|uniref:Secreted protein n=1 Tax=Chitinophaga rhizophila TaxID=2866212 RepID=A0ABS7G8H4_9BACT|nr:hypothetical protein [Chitinophaga rhizophila]MBW8682997.1 hypothetical protein [Chitinophaga rhizophila]
MKKVLALILAVLYMGTSTGATLHMHYCMGELTGVQLWHSEAKAKQCSKCGRTSAGKMRAKKCCKDEHKTVKLEKDQKATENVAHGMQLVAVANPVYYFDSRPVHTTAIAEEYPVTNAPPGGCCVHIHVLNCVFRV